MAVLIPRFLLSSPHRKFTAEMFWRLCLSHHQSSLGFWSSQSSCRVPCHICRCAMILLGCRSPVGTRSCTRRCPLLWYSSSSDWQGFSSLSHRSLHWRCRTLGKVCGGSTSVRGLSGRAPHRRSRSGLQWTRWLQRVYWLRPGTLEHKALCLFQHLPLRQLGK